MRVITSRRPAERTGPRPHPPTMDHIWICPSASGNWGRPYTASHKQRRIGSIHTHLSGINVTSGSSHCASYTFTCLLNYGLHSRMASAAGLVACCYCRIPGAVEVLPVFRLHIVHAGAGGKVEFVRVGVQHIGDGWCF